ncbi:hypothetical protein ACFIQG_20300 [Comamonas odontotermitis]|uniref:hypothetical protein n=1 Tax=Comamonas odontotermitis TaxID=379895 RepID=UPI00366DB6AE
MKHTPISPIFFSDALCVLSFGLAVAGCAHAQQAPAVNGLSQPPNLLAAQPQSTALVQPMQQGLQGAQGSGMPASANAAAPARTKVVSADTVGYGWQPEGSYVTEEKLQKAKNSLTSMNADGKYSGSYEWSKSRCMVNLAEHTFREVRTDGSTEYLYQTARLLALAAKNGEAVSFKTPQIPGYSRANPDLWAQLQGLESQGPIGPYRILHLVAALAYQAANSGQ